MIKRLLVWTAVLIVSITANSGLSAERHFNKDFNVSAPWKRDKVLLTYERCMKVQGDNDRCRQFIDNIRKSEDANAQEIIAIIRDYDVNIGQLDKQASVCRYYSDYEFFVVCHSALLSRIKDEINGETLLAD